MPDTPAGSDPRALIKAGRLDEALAASQALVRSRPGDGPARVQLFQMYALIGQWSKALDQLGVACELNAKDYMVIAQVGGRALNAMAFRDEVFAGRREPKVLGEPEEWVGQMLQAVKLNAAGNARAAADLRARALEAAPAIPGRINGEPFEWLADADQRFGPIIELILENGYYWVPMGRIAELKLDPPEHLHDLVFTPVNVRWSNGGEAIGMIPVRYPGSEACPDGAIRLARATRWSDDAEAPFGLGQRLLASDQGEYPLLEVRNVQLAPEAAGGGAHA